MLARLPWRSVPLARPRFPLLAPTSLLLFCGSLFLQGISSRDLWASHEARAAQNAQGMLDDGNWLLPRLYDGQVELQKPAGFYWLVATVGWLRGGIDPVAVRLPAVFAGTVTVLLVWWHLRQRGRPVAGFVAAAVLAGAVHFTGTARIGRIDVPLACVVTAIMLVGREGTAEREVSRSAVPSWLARGIGIGVLGGIALLLKGPIGFVLPAAALSAFWLLDRAPSRPIVLPGLTAAIVSLAIALPWYLWASYATDGEFFRVFFLYHHLNRAFGGAEALAGHPWWFYLPRFANDYLPWTPLFLIALARRRWRGDDDARFGLVWFVVMLAVLSCSRFKRADYLLPAYAGAAIFVGCAVERWYLARTSRSRRRVACGFALTLALLPAWWLEFDRVVTAKEEAAHAQAPFAHQIREVAPAPEPILFFRVEAHLLAYHLGRPVHTLVEWSDLDEWVRAAGPHYVVTRVEFLEEFRQRVAGPCEILARNDGPAHRPLVLLRIGTDAWPTNPPRD
jgi:4-amino-4-deoxy-L-arabinose transferase-like glycosyltransferase